MSKRLWPLVLFPLICCVAAASAQESDLDASIAKWEKDIAKLEELELAEPKSEQSILFYGSSSIRRWKTIADDMAPWPAIRRGYGGAKLPDVIHYAPRIVGPHIGVDNPNRCRAVVLFVANDITEKNNERHTRRRRQSVYPIAPVDPPAGSDGSRILDRSHAD